jgi:sortase A
MRKRLDRIIEGCLYLGGVAMVLYWGGYQAWAEYDRREQVAAFQHAHDPDTSLWSENRVLAFRATQAVGADDPLGVLQIPSGLQIPIYAGASDFNLDRGIAWIEGTAGFDEEGGNVGIAGHRDGFFRGLKDVKLGDRMEVTTALGQRTYEVSDLAVVDPSDVSPLDGTYSTSLTLVTCYPFYFVGHAPQRYIVRADAVVENHNQNHDDER